MEAAFRHPEVPDAYKSGGTTLRAVVLMLGAGLISAWIGGWAMVAVALVYLAVDPTLPSLNAPKIDDLVGAGVAFMALFIISGAFMAVGWVVGSVVNKAGMWGKNRSRWLAGVLGVAFGGAVAAFYVVGMVIVGAVSLDVGPSVEFSLVAGWMFMFCLAGAANAGYTRPFCEHCDAFMEVVEFDPFGIAREDEVLNAVKSGEPVEHLDDGIDVRSESHVTVELSYCPVCKDNGIVSIESHLREKIDRGRGKQPGIKEAVRRILSQQVAGSSAWFAAATQGRPPRFWLGRLLGFPGHSGAPVMRNHSARERGQVRLGPPAGGRPG